MPSKNPDVWVMIWEWVVLNISPSSLHSAVAALVMAILRMLFMRKKPAFRYMLLDAAMCASIAGTLVPVIEKFTGHPELAGFIGTMIGFVGTEELRRFLFKFLNKKIETGIDNEQI